MQYLREICMIHNFCTSNFGSGMSNIPPRQSQSPYPSGTKYTYIII